EHARATLKALKAMPLSSEDLVYLSPFVEQTGSTYQRQGVEKRLEPMDEEEIETELERLAAKIRARGLKASRYDIREFIY
ncbi:MAG: radical SAM protein, partial [Thermoanaerobaculia bacterium]